MISFRFHVVSLTAVFLAIAIGVIVGTTYVDRAVVENLENRIDTVSGNLDERRAQIDDLEEALGDLRSYAGASAEFAVTHRLPDVPVVLLAARGVDENHAQQLATLVRRAGARTPGVIWLEESWDLSDEDERSRLAGVLGTDADRPPGWLAREGLTAVVDALVAPADTDLQLAPGGALLAAVTAAGFLAVDDLGDSAVTLASMAGSGARVLVLTGTESADGVGDLVPDLAGTAVDAGLPTVVADAFVVREDGPGRGEAVWSDLGEDLRERLVVVDAADLPEGRVAAVLGVAEAAAGRTGRFGYGSDVDGALPAWSTP